MRRGRLAGKSVGMQSSENRIPTAVANKHPASPGSVVGGWRKTDNINASLSVAGTRHRFSPVVQVAVAFHFFLGRMLTVNNGALEFSNGAHRGRTIVLARTSSRGKT